MLGGDSPCRYSQGFRLNTDFRNSVPSAVLVKGPRLNVNSTVLNQRVLNVQPQKVVRRWKLDAGAASRCSRHAQPPLAQCGAALISVRCVSIAPFRLAVRRDAVDEEHARYVRRGGRDERVQAEDVLREHGHRFGEPRGQPPVGAIVKLNKSACNARILASPAASS